MTITGKCDICRRRKVKCDEAKPKCGACRKRDRVCSYSYGKVTAFVVEDPIRLSKHGRSTETPIIQSIPSWAENGSSSSTSQSPMSSSDSPCELQMTSGRVADDDNGTFMTLAVLPSHAPTSISKRTAQQRKKLQSYLNRLRESPLISLLQPSSLDSKLVTRYLDILGRRPLKDQPFLIVGSWIESIPSRIGTSPVVDLAIEYLADSFAVYRDNSYSTKITALATKSRALKQLQLQVSDDRTRATWNTTLAMKIHFMAEVLMGLKHLHHIVHTIALVEILRAGPVAEIDVDHYWNFLDNTYHDDVTEALVSGRTTVFDNDFYLETSSPANIPADAPATFRLSVVMMHIFIQLPRLVCLIRHAIGHPEDSQTIELAISLAQSLWTLDPSDIAEQILQSTTTIISTPPGPSIADIVSESLHFDSIENALLLTRYWLLEVNFSGALENLVSHFPRETASLLLPNLSDIRRKEMRAAKRLAQSLQYGVYTCPSLPILPLRIHTTLIWSIGSWHRLYNRTKQALEASQTNSEPAGDAGLRSDLEHALRMQRFVADEANRLNRDWGIEPVSDKYIFAAALSAVGNDIPDWMATSVRFEPEGGEMVMKVEYGIPPEVGTVLGMDDEQEKFTRHSTTTSPFGKDRLMPSNVFPPLERGVASQRILYQDLGLINKE